jgi:hypothetical protein
MSRIDEIKKQYPELNVSFLDIITNLDTSKTYKYTPLFCKLLAKRLNLKHNSAGENFNDVKLRYESSLINRGISTINLTDNQLYVYNILTEYFPSEIFFTIKEFMYFMEKNQIENNDVTSYSSIDEMRSAITLASIKELTKELESQVIKEYEDETWVAVRPLTFDASAKYGAGTRWCTTYQREKNYFERYWRQGILVYFINKKTGYKFAGFKSLQDKEMSFWNADDSRIDYLEIEIENYMFSIVKNIFSSKSTNKNLCSDEIQEQVHKECIESYEKMRVEYISEPDETIPLDEQAMVAEIERAPDEPNQALREAAQRYVRTMTAVPVFTEPSPERA